jgi:hypothetical protein
MDEITRLLALLGAGGVLLTVLAGGARWWNDEARQLKRGLRAILGGEPHGLIVARGRGRGVGFNFMSNQVAVAWDRAWGLLYGLDELDGAEAIVDGQVVGRARRGEARRAIDALGGAETRVALRFIFDDAAHPDFVLDLWLAEDEGRRHELPPDEAIAEANRWLQRIEALFKRPGQSSRPASVVRPIAPEPAPGPPAEPAAEAAPERFPERSSERFVGQAFEPSAVPPAEPAPLFRTLEAHDDFVPLEEHDEPSEDAA